MQTRRICQPQTCTGHLQRKEVKPRSSQSQHWSKKKTRKEEQLAAVGEKTEKKEVVWSSVRIVAGTLERK